MKQIPVLLVLGFALSLCNLTNKLKPSSKSGGPGKTATGSSDTDGAVEKATPTAAQTAALAGGQDVKWDAQGMSWTVPPKWTESTESKEFLWRSPGGFDAANLIVTSRRWTKVSNRHKHQGVLRSGEELMKNGEVDEVRWLEIDGLRGVEFREANPKSRMDQTIAVDGISKVCRPGAVGGPDAESSGQLPKHQDAMYGVLYSTKLVH